MRACVRAASPPWAQAANITYFVLAVPDAKTAVAVAAADVPCFTVDDLDIRDTHAGGRPGRGAGRGRDGRDG